MDSYIICILSALISLFLAILYDPPPIFTRIINRNHRTSPTLNPSRTITTDSSAGAQEGAAMRSHCHCGDAFRLLDIKNDRTLESIRGVALDYTQDILPQNEGIALLHFILSISTQVVMFGAMTNTEEIPPIERVRDAAAELYTRYGGLADGSSERLRCLQPSEGLLHQAAMGSVTIAQITLKLLLKLDGEPDARQTFEAFYDRPNQEQYHTAVGRYPSVQSITVDTLRPHSSGIPLPRPRRSWTILPCHMGAFPLEAEQDIEAARSAREREDVHSTHTTESVELLAGLVTAVILRHAIVEVGEAHGFSCAMVKRKG